MARRAASSWPGYMRELLQLWNQLDLGDDFKVGNFSHDDVEALSGQIEDSLTKIQDLEGQLANAIAERERVIRELEKLGVQFRLAIALKYGLQSKEVQLVPKVAAAPKGRSRKKEKTDSENADKKAPEE